MATLLSRPTLSGTMHESPYYQTMGLGTTDSIMLMGHADARIMYEPYQVYNMQAAVNHLGGDPFSPLMRGLVEAYNGGCRDIWVYPVAPMSEYEATVADRFDAKYSGQNFYQRYYDRLTTAYASILDFDMPELIVPLEAVFYETRGVDFLTQLVNYCSTVFTNTGQVCLGIMGTRIALPTHQSIVEMATDPRLDDYGSNGKFVMVTIGEGIIANPQMSVSYSGSLVTQVAANLAVESLARSVGGMKYKNASALVGRDYTPAELEMLTGAKLNPSVRTTRGKRGAGFEVKLLTDNTLGADGSDFWAMSQMHIVANVINMIRALGYSYIGTILRDKFREDVNNYLSHLRSNEYIRDFTLAIEDADVRGEKVTVNVGLSPIFGIRNIFFTTNVGPGA